MTDDDIPPPVRCAEWTELEMGAGMLDAVIVGLAAFEGAGLPVIMDRTPRGLTLRIDVPLPDPVRALLPCKMPPPPIEPVAVHDPSPLIAFAQEVERMTVAEPEEIPPPPADQAEEAPAEVPVTYEPSADGAGEAAAPAHLSPGLAAVTGTQRRRALEAYLDGLPFDGAWTAADDAELVQLLGQGRRIAVVAATLGVKEAEAHARFRLLSKPIRKHLPRQAMGRTIWREECTTDGMILLNALLADRAKRAAA